MTVVKIPTKKITQFESKQIPTIEQENKIFKKDNIGTVVPGDALRNINLSTVPSVVQDAINAMGLSVETNILANALLLQIQRDIDNLGDAIVEKSYIDGQVSYLTSLLGQKSDTGDVAAIVDSRLAIVTNNLATTSQVNSLNTRVDESESSIVTLNQTINTKDAARATQIEEVEARVDQSLSNYTAVLNLTVDKNGNVISQKLDSLVAQNENLSISIDETNQLIIDKDNEWNAKSIKLITSPTGAITGYSFQNGSGLKSTFEINADNFKIANSYNTYTPFSISGTSLYFNGKVAFTNITGTSDLVSTANIQNAIANNVTTIDGGKIVTNQVFVNNLNAVGGVVADTITGNELNGIVINGARINGSVIKTSYLDLDGELEVLTNYHITVAMYNANPSLYTDAVYISADNEYRIPSMSNLTSFLKEVGNPSGPYLGGTYILNSELYSYASANIGTNRKAVKARPIITIASSSGSAIPENHLYNAVFATLNSGSGYFRFYIGNLLILSVVKSGTSVSYSGLAGSGSIASPAYDNINIVNLSYGGMAFSVRRMTFYGDRIFVTYGGATNLQIMNDWSSGQIRVEAYSQSGEGLNSLVGLRLPAITINNMI